MELQGSRLTAILDAVPTAVWFTDDPEARWIFANTHAAKLLRLTSGGLLSGPRPDNREYRPFRQGKPLPFDQLPLHRAIRGEYILDEEIELRFRDGTDVHLVCQAAPICNPSGGILAAVCGAIDVTSRNRTENALRRSEHRFRTLINASADVVYCMSADWRSMQQLAGHEFIADTSEPSRTWLDKYILPEDQVCMLGAINEAIRTKSMFQLEHRIARPDGSIGWTSSRALPILDENGELREWIGTATDITARKQYEAEREMLMRELDHRLKNTLANIQAIAIQTFADASDIQTARKVFMDRLSSVARAHDVLIREHWEGAGLKEMLAKSLEFFDGKSARITFSGPELKLSPKGALSFSLAVHELATNAAKYGALSNDTGRVQITWSIDDVQKKFSLSWIESGGPKVDVPTRHGFGSRMIQTVLARNLGGEASLQFLPRGIVCTVSAPLSEISANESTRTIVH